MEKVYIIEWEWREFRGVECVKCTSGVLPRFYLTKEDAEGAITTDIKRLRGATTRQCEVSEHTLDFGDVLYRYKVSELERG